MNYYEHHLGDYMRDTAHLSMIEDAAYRRLLDAYYIRERPLPEDFAACCKLARAQTEQEREAVAYVLREFFELQDDGWHNKRCDEEIARYRDKQARARRNAEARWSKRQHCDGNAVALQPQCDGNAVALQPQCDGNAVALQPQCDGNAVALQPQCDGNAHQTPDTSTPDTSVYVDVDVDDARARARDGAADRPGLLASASPPPNGLPPADPPPISPPPADPIHARAVELAVLLRRRGAALQASDPRVRGWAERGITDAQALMALETAQRQRHGRGSPQPINAGYLDAILQSQATADSRLTARRSIHDERAEVIAVLTGRRRAQDEARVIDITPDVQPPLARCLG